MDRSLAGQKKALLRLTLAQAAFGQAAALCEHLIKESIPSGSDLAAAMMTGIIVTYAKPFTRSDGIGPLPTGFREFQSSSALEHFHQTALDARNSVYAHRDYKSAPALAGSAFCEEIAYSLIVTIKEHGHDVLVNEPQITASDASKFQALCDFQHARAADSVGKLIASLKSTHSLAIGKYEISDAIRAVS